MRTTHFGASLAGGVVIALCVGATSAQVVEAPQRIGLVARGDPAVPGEAVLLDDVPLAQLRPVPAVMHVQTHYSSDSPGHATTTAVGLSTGKLVYSNTHGTYLFRPGMGNRVADDLYTDAVSPCALHSTRVLVNGGVENGNGEFHAIIRLWDGCPGGDGERLEGGQKIFFGLPDDADLFHELVLDFSDHGICDDGAECQVSLQDCADASYCQPAAVIMPPTVWLQVWFTTATAGIILGAPAEVGFSPDNFDHGLAPCFSWFGGWPRQPQASFWAQVYTDPQCETHHLAYLAAGPLRPGYGLYGSSRTRFADDVELFLAEGSCELSAYELGMVGSSGQYDMDMDLRWPDLDTVIEGSHHVFTGKGDGRLELARGRVSPGRFISAEQPPIWITWQVSQGGAGVPQVREVATWTQPGTSSPSFARQPSDGNWYLHLNSDGSPAVFYAAVYCRGDTPRGACCPWQEAGAETICYDDVSALGCHPFDERYQDWGRWLADSTCEENAFDPPCGMQACCLPGSTCENLIHDECVSVCEDDPYSIPCDADGDCLGARVCQADGSCSPKCALWDAQVFCDTPQHHCSVLDCYYATGDCFDAEEEIPCDDDFDCPFGQGCLPNGVCSSRGGCDQLGCCDEVCRENPSCCMGLWDSDCVTRALALCPLPPCPSGVITWLDPPANIIDARQPYPVYDSDNVQTVDTFLLEAPADAIVGVVGWCWTAIEVDTRGNVLDKPIERITHNGSGNYSIVLSEPIAPGTLVQISYAADAVGVFASLPGDTDGDQIVSSYDLTFLIDCLNFARDCTAWQTDIDRSGVTNPQDLLRFIDLFNGAGQYGVWRGRCLAPGYLP